MAWFKILFDNHKFRDNITGSVVSFYVVVDVSVVFVREARFSPTWLNSSTDFTTAADQSNLTPPCPQTFEFCGIQCEIYNAVLKFSYRYFTRRPSLNKD